MSEDLKDIYSRSPEIFRRLRKEIDEVIVGQDIAIEQLLISLLAGGHALLESNPGLAKTLLVKTTASCLGLDYSRIQCTPDLMPADITGTTIIEETEKGKAFRFEIANRDLHIEIFHIARGIMKEEIAFVAFGVFGSLPGRQ